jgi:hypothetical protein
MTATLRSLGLQTTCQKQAWFANDLGRPHGLRLGYPLLYSSTPTFVSSDLDHQCWIPALEFRTETIGAFRTFSSGDCLVCSIDVNCQHSGVSNSNILSWRLASATPSGLQSTHPRSTWQTRSLLPENSLSPSEVEELSFQGRMVELTPTRTDRDLEVISLHSSSIAGRSDNKSFK